MPPASTNKLLRSHLRRMSGFIWVGGQQLPRPPPARRAASTGPSEVRAKFVPAMAAGSLAVPEPQTPEDMPVMFAIAPAPAEVPHVALGEPAVPASPGHVVDVEREEPAVPASSGHVVAVAVATAKKSPPAVPLGPVPPAPEEGPPAQLAVADEPAVEVIVPAAAPEAQDVPMGPAEEAEHGRPPPDDEPAAQRRRVDQVRAWIPGIGWRWVLYVEDLPPALP